MVNPSESIAKAIERTVHGPMWHGPALRELLADVSPEEAARHPVAGGHSIWEIALHITAWAQIAGRRLAGEHAEPSELENWPPVGMTTLEAWSAALEALRRSHHELAQAVKRLDAEQLAALVAGRTYSEQAMLQGVVEHGAYHGGQIAILKRAVRKGN
jgi:uncharacterized damage-inducible protein DinB